MNIKEQLKETEKQLSCLEVCEECLSIVDDFYENNRIVTDLKQRVGEVSVLHRQLMLLKLKLIQLDNNLGKGIR
jgi:uncharacterized protein YerC